MNKMLNTIELFAGCGGLVDGFEKSNKFTALACVEWNKAPLDVLKKRFKNKYLREDVDDFIIRFDIQRTEELIYGWKDDIEYGTGIGLRKIIKNNTIDVIAGGPPCQAYSLAGRIQDKNGMHDDYRNFLFESYIKVVDEFKPKAIIFENVEGMLSAKPGGINIVASIKKKFNDIGYELIDDFKKYALIDLSNFGLPQKRKRVILLGIRKDSFEGNKQEALKDFYINILNGKRSNYMTVREAIGDLPIFLPSKEIVKVGRKKFSHLPYETGIDGHYPRFHNERDITIFSDLAMDIETGEYKYKNTEILKKIYTEKTGNISKVHKYNVLDWNEPSNTITAHLKKDGLRYIHPDPKQGRTITVREAARLQTFDDDFLFSGKMTNDYEMIGNAVPPKFAKILAESLYEFFKKHDLI